ncbi:hypothetical protein HMPREF3185_01614 [Porphyromonas somerae]|uniref:Uncharacterized protein n=1 Tax=Porphyromonas somerae TaxID=322095 RepID=A0A134B471_9PORP|nr:hypothetical protein HMPREF3184_01614 [Porphyromonadaceae bacterium KA00676]KXB74722.1 hypothetical protein HMPREF3185_01614 [Porphyromonas somerae]
MQAIWKHRLPFARKDKPFFRPSISLASQLAPLGRFAGAIKRLSPHPPSVGNAGCKPYET